MYLYLPIAILFISLWLCYKFYNLAESAKQGVPINNINLPNYGSEVFSASAIVGVNLSLRIKELFYLLLSYACGIIYLMSLILTGLLLFYYLG